jgi:hypothetical protein
MLLFCRIFFLTDSERCASASAKEYTVGNGKLSAFATVGGFRELKFKLPCRRASRNPKFRPERSTSQVGVSLTSFQGSTNDRHNCRCEVLGSQICLRGLVAFSCWLAFCIYRYCVRIQLLRTCRQTTSSVYSATIRSCTEHRRRQTGVETQ